MLKCLMSWKDTLSTAHELQLASLLLIKTATGTGSKADNPICEENNGITRIHVTRFERP